jgi:tetratricopeptide (TPR) repeat protein
MPSGDAKSAQTSRLRAQAALDLGRNREGEEHARAALAEEPHNAYAHGLLARALLGLGRNEEAKKEALAALAIDPEEEWHHRLHALALRKVKKNEALEAAREAVRLAPDEAPPHYVCSLMLKDLGRTKEAIEAIELAMKIDPESTTYKRAFGDLYLDSDPKRAESLYRETLAIDARDALALNNLGVALQKQRRPLEAASAFKAALLIDPNLKVARRNTHATVRSFIGGTLGVLIGGVIAARIVMVGGRAFEHRSTILLAAGAIAVVATLGVAFALKIRRKRALEAADPHLRSIYEELERDRKAGRL